MSEELPPKPPLALCFVLEDWLKPPSYLDAQGMIRHPLLEHATDEEQAMLRKAVCSAVSAWQMLVMARASDASYKAVTNDWWRLHLGRHPTTGEVNLISEMQR